MNTNRSDREKLLRKVSLYPFNRCCDRKTKTSALSLPIRCSHCHGTVHTCSCPNGLAQWWTQSTRTTSTSAESTKKISANESKSSNPQYVLLDWTNRRSLLDYLSTQYPKETLSSLSLKELQRRIEEIPSIHRFNSFAELFRSQSSFQLGQIYIDRSFYSSIPSAIPLTQSSIIADTIHLPRAIEAIHLLARQLGVQIDPITIDAHTRKSLLEQQSIYLSSRRNDREYSPISLTSESSTEGNKTI